MNFTKAKVNVYMFYFYYSGQVLIALVLFEEYKTLDIIIRGMKKVEEK